MAIDLNNVAMKKGNKTNQITRDLVSSVKAICSTQNVLVIGLLDGDIMILTFDLKKMEIENCGTIEMKTPISRIIETNDYKVVIGRDKTILIRNDQLINQQISY